MRLLGTASFAIVLVAALSAVAAQRPGTRAGAAPASQPATQPTTRRAFPPAMIDGKGRVVYLSVVHVVRSLPEDLALRPDAEPADYTAANAWLEENVLGARVAHRFYVRSVEVSEEDGTVTVKGDTVPPPWLRVDTSPPPRRHPALGTCDVTCRFPEAEKAKLTKLRDGDRLEVIGSSTRLAFSKSATERRAMDVRFELDDCEAKRAERLTPPANRSSPDAQIDGSRRSR